MNSDLKRQEKASLDAIDKYIKKKIRSSAKDYNEAVEKKNPNNCQGPTLVTDIDCFWEECVKKFRDQIEELFEIPTQEFPDKETEQSKITCDNQNSSFEITFSKVSVEYIDEKITRIEKKYNELITDCGLTNTEIEKFDKIYWQIVNELVENLNRLKEGHSSNSPWEKMVFGRVNLDYIRYLLDLQDNEIRKLLPYLLTSYIFNFCNSRYFYDNKATISLLIPWLSFTKNYCDNRGQKDKKVKKDNTSKIDCAEISKLVFSSKGLANVFSLSKCHLESICSINQENRGYDGPEPLIWRGVLYRAWKKEVPVPLIRYKELAEDILELWVSAINKTASIAKIDGFPENIDLEMCRALVRHYCADDGQNEPGK